MVTYSADAPFMPRLLRVPGGVSPGTMVDVQGWENDQIRGQVRQVERTYTVVGLMNEHQLSLGETTTGGRRELVDRKGLLDYDGLMMLTLQRAKTAREAITSSTLSARNMATAARARPSRSPTRTKPG